MKKLLHGLVTLVVFGILGGTLGVYLVTDTRDVDRWISENVLGR